ncbi:MAG: DMT family transporter [Flavobacterium sp.]|nr:DMT family transporter [Flavobacterium sp.]
MPNDNLKSYLHLHLIVFIWGFTAILGRLITLDAMPLVWFRMFFAVIFILLFIKYKKIATKIPRKMVLKFLVAGLVIALHWFTFFRAIKVSNVSITLACLSTGAFFTSLIEPIFFGKKIIWYEIFFGLLVVAGLCIIFNVEGHYIEGILLALLSAFLSASFAVINSKFVKDYEPTVISVYELAGGVLFFSIFLLFTNSFTTDFFQLKLHDLLYLFILSSICTAYAFIASTAVMKYLSPYTVMLTINLEPIYGIILAVIIFKEKEQMSTGFYFGALLIVVTVILNGILKSRTKVN